MPMQPLDIQKTRFAHKMRGYDPVEVENFLALVAEDLTQRLGEIERLERDNRSLRERVTHSEERERQLHDAILRGKKRHRLERHRTTGARARRALRRS